jgi:hypothetical protein
MSTTRTDKTTLTWLWVAVLATFATAPFLGCQGRSSSDPPVSAAVREGEPASLTERVRLRLVDAPRLTRAGRNVAIIVDGIDVTLRGVVPTEDEKLEVERAARQASGVGEVRSELVVGVVPDPIAGFGASAPSGAEVTRVDAAPAVMPMLPQPQPQMQAQPLPQMQAQALPQTPPEPPQAAGVTPDAATGPWDGPLPPPGTGSGSPLPDASTAPVVWTPSAVPPSAPAPGTPAPAPANPGTVTTPAPTPPGSTISPTNPGMNTPTTRNPPQMGPGTGNAPISK